MVHVVRCHVANRLVQSLVEKFKRIKSEVDAYEKFEKLEDKLPKERKREPIPQEVKMLVWKQDEGLDMFWWKAFDAPNSFSVSASSRTTANPALFPGCFFLACQSVLNGPSGS